MALLTPEQRAIKKSGFNMGMILGLAIAAGAIYTTENICQKARSAQFDTKVAQAFEQQYVEFKPQPPFGRSPYRENVYQEMRRAFIKGKIVTLDSPNGIIYGSREQLEKIARKGREYRAVLEVREKR